MSTWQFLEKRLSPIGKAQADDFHLLLSQKLLTIFAKNFKKTRRNSVQKETPGPLPDIRNSPSSLCGCDAVVVSVADVLESDVFPFSPAISRGGKSIFYLQYQKTKTNATEINKSE